MARYNQTAIQDMLDGLRAAKAQIDALTKERDEAVNKCALIASAMKMPKLNPKTEAEIERAIADDLVKERDERIAALEKALTFRRLQDEQRPWVEHNFKGRESWKPLIGALEELGELAHAHLKGAQGIRGTKEEHAEAAKDAVADIIIFLADYCSAMGYDMQECVETTWATVKQRDWKANPQNGYATKGEL